VGGAASCIEEQMPQNSPQLYLFDGERLTPRPVESARPLRWAAWHPTDGWCLLAGNGGTALRFEPSRAAGNPAVAIDPGSRTNLRGAAFSPDGRRALLVGNQGAVLLLEGEALRPLPSPTSENLRRVAWRPDGACALIVGNAGTVLRYQDGELHPLPGDRAHTLRAIAWRPDGAYALVGAYASRYAGYPRPHALYRCDGRYLQALLATDQEDDFVAIDWHPSGREALIVGYAFDGGVASNKLVTYDGSGFQFRSVDAPGSLLGASWRPQGDYALLAGEDGGLLRYPASEAAAAGQERIEQLASGTGDNLVGPFWKPDGSLAVLLRGPSERVYTV